MSKLFVSALALALAAGSAYAQDARYPPPDDNAHFAWADVLRVDPVYGVARTVTPSQQCYDQPVVQQNPGNSAAGTVLGAVIGGVLGSTVGHGGGRTAATVGGAVVGGAVGNSVSDHGSSYETTQTTCQQVNTVSDQRRISGYDVEYRYRGEVFKSRLNYDPGERLRVRVSVAPAD